MYDEVLFNKSVAEVVQVFKSEGMYRHFIDDSKTRLNRTKAAESVCKRTANMLCWIHFQISDRFLKGEDVMQFFFEFLQTYYQRLTNYCLTWLAVRLKLKPSTVLNYINDFSLAAKWRAYHFIEFDSAKISLEAFSCILSGIRK
jgi:hypothetical protein